MRGPAGEEVYFLTPKEQAAVCGGGTGNVHEETPTPRRSKEIESVRDVLQHGAESMRS